MTLSSRPSKGTYDLLKPLRTGIHSVFILHTSSTDPQECCQKYGQLETQQCTVEQTELKQRQQTSSAVQIRSSLFWVVKQRILAVIY